MGKDKAKPKRLTKVVTRISIPITGLDADRELLRKLDAVRDHRGLKNRSEMIRILIGEEYQRAYPQIIEGKER